MVSKDDLTLIGSVIAILKDVAITACTLITTVYVIKGLNKWRSEMIGKNRYEATRDLLLKLTELKSLLMHLRERKGNLLNPDIEVELNSWQKWLIESHNKLASSTLVFETVSGCSTAQMLDDFYSTFNKAVHALLNQIKNVQQWKHEGSLGKDERLIYTEDFKAIFMQENGRPMDAFEKEVIAAFEKARLAIRKILDS